ncbi:MAG: DUF2341 domain-containing protein [Candidatus Heimdallarchaeota archaeon]
MVVKFRLKTIIITLLLGSLFFNSINFSLELAYGSQITPQEINVQYDDWYNPAWQYRTKIYVNWNQIEVLTDFQALLFLPEGINFGLFQPDGSDIRITTSDNDEIHFFVEFWGIYSFNRIWIRFPRINASSQFYDYIYLYYGNEAAESKSSGEDTFLFFDDFEDRILGTKPRDWVVTSTFSGDLIVTNNGIFGVQGIHYTDTDYFGYPICYRDLGMNFSGHALEYFVNPNNPDYSGGLAYTSSSSSFSGGGNTLFGDQGDSNISCFDGSEYKIVYEGYSTFSWYLVSLRFINATHYDHYIRNIHNIDFYHQYIVPFWGNASSLQYIQFWQYASSICSLYLDGFRIRKLAKSNLEPVLVLNETSHYVDIPDTSSPNSKIIGYNSLAISLTIFVFFTIICNLKSDKRRKKF